MMAPLMFIIGAVVVVFSAVVIGAFLVIAGATRGKREERAARQIATDVSALPWRLCRREAEGFLQSKGRPE